MLYYIILCYIILHCVVYYPLLLRAPLPNHACYDTRSSGVCCKTDSSFYPNLCPANQHHNLPTP